VEDHLVEVVALYQAIDRLTLDCRAVVVLKRLEGLSEAEVALHLGLSRDQVKRLDKRALNQLRYELLEVAA
jgi:RNA polymerase sigma factor (sigma-70 family)